MTGGLRDSDGSSDESVSRQEPERTSFRSGSGQPRGTGFTKSPPPEVARWAWLWRSETSPSHDGPLEAPPAPQPPIASEDLSRPSFRTGAGQWSGTGVAVVVAGILVVGALGVFGLSRIGSGDSDSVVTSTVPDTAPPVVPSGVASPEFWIEGVEMLQPPCDGGWITIVMSAAENQIIRGLYNFPGGGYLRTDITCASLNPRVPSGRYAGDPLYLVFFGPFYDRFEAQQQCLALGIRNKSSCFVAPLTNDPADRSRRYGPLDQ